MLFDFNEAWSRPSQALYDVCVCGTGPAGITIARKLAGHGKRVLLLEAGGLSFSEESQDHYKGKSLGKNTFWWLETGRLRYFGGASNHWGGICAVIDTFNDEVTAEGRLPGWPISRKDAYHHLDEAKNILDIPGADYTPVKIPGFESPLFGRYVNFHSAPTRFAKKYGDEIRNSPQIDAFYNANVVDIRLGDSLTRVKNLLVRTYDGKKVEVSAGRFVLALGAIENARTLLNANSQIPSGIGNQSDMLGRCFMESLGVHLGRFLVTDTTFFQSGGVDMVATQELVRTKNINNCVVHYASNYQVRSYTGRLRFVKNFLRDTACLSPTATSLARHIQDFNCPGDGVIHSLIEQEANRNSRVTLGDDLDTFGLRRIQINWQFSERDYRTMRVAAIESAKEMARLNRARAQLAPYILDPNLEIEGIGINGHHMGVTRMSADPRYGVVDGNCKVHGIDNLYVAGSSIFPRCGGRNPTMTIVALALRLGEHLSQQP
jgi:choline dehydrogenase-like flavoprotein